MIKPTFIIDHEIGKVTVNGKVIPYSEYNYLSVALEFAGIDTYRGDIKGLKQAADILGTSCANFAKMINGAMFNGYIRKNIKMIHRINYIKGVYDARVIKLVNEKETIIEEYQKDGNNHLAAYALVIGNSAEAKKCLGKGLWKAVCNNSMTRNDTIVNIIINVQYNKYPVMTNEELRLLVGIINKVPSTLFKVIGFDMWENLLNICVNTGINSIPLRVIKEKNSLLKNINKHNINVLSHIIKDTSKMCNYVGYKFNSSWSTKRIMKEHDIVTKMVEAKNNSPELLNSLANFPKTVTFIGATAYLLKSRYEIVKHGKEQHHCVASYANQIAAGSYVVYKIEKTGTPTATFGIDLVRSSIGIQLYGPCNSCVDDEDILYTSKQLKKIINKVSKNIPKIELKEVSMVPQEDDIPF